jgi:hypothetical protein
MYNQVGMEGESDRFSGPFLAPGGRLSLPLALLILGTVLVLGFFGEVRPGFRYSGEVHLAWLLELVRLSGPMAKAFVQP